MGQEQAPYWMEASIGGTYPKSWVSKNYGWYPSTCTGTLEWGEVNCINVTRLEESFWSCISRRSAINIERWVCVSLLLICLSIHHLSYYRKGCCTSALYKQELEWLRGNQQQLLWRGQPRSIKQGCSLPPFLFNLIMQAVLKSVADEVDRLDQEFTLGFTLLQRIM